MDSALLTPEFLAAKAAKELNETPERRETDLQEFRRLLASEKNLTVPLEDTEFLLRFLRVSKFNVKKAFDRIRSYYSNFTRYRRDLEQMTPTGLTEVLRNNVHIRIPARMPDGGVIAYYKIGAWDIEKHHVDKIFQTNWLCIEHGLEKEDTHITGGVLIMDCKGLSLRHIFQISPDHLLKVYNVFAKGLPVRCKAIHVLNAGSLTDGLHKLIVNFLPKKIKKRLYIHGSSLKSLHNHISPKLLPVELGGDLGELNNESMAREMLEWEPIWLRRREYGYKKK